LALNHCAFQTVVAGATTVAHAPNSRKSNRARAKGSGIFSQKIDGSGFALAPHLLTTFWLALCALAS